MRVLSRTLAASAAASVLGLGALTACADDEPTTGESASPSGSSADAETTAEESDDPSSAESSQPAQGETGPGGVRITAPGSEVPIPGAAVVSWDLGGEQAVARIRVTRFERATQKVFQDWVLEKDARRTTPYFARLKVTNLARTDLGGLVLPIYGAAPDNVFLSPSTFKAEFRACPDAELPEKLKKGTTARSCLVFLAPKGDRLSGVSFYPAEGVDPIAWTGDATRYDPTPKRDKQR